MPSFPETVVPTLVDPRVFESCPLQLFDPLVFVAKPPVHSAIVGNMNMSFPRACNTPNVIYVPMNRILVVAWPTRKQGWDPIHNFKRQPELLESFAPELWRLRQWL